MIKGLRYAPGTERSSVTLDQAFDTKRNSLGFLRMVFAAMVLFDHAFPLGGFNHGTDPMWGWTHGQESFGGLAVAGFFVVSGYLVTRSFTESRTAVRYLWKRVLRIFPGFWVCLLVTVAVFGTIAYVFDHSTLHGYVFGHPDSPGGYLGRNALLQMNQYNIDGLLSTTPFQHSGYPQAFDGSLWTLIYEFKCYLAVAVLGVFGIFRWGRPAVLVLALGLWVAQLQDVMHPNRLRGIPVIGDPNMMILGFVFCLGALLYLYRDKILLSDTMALVAAVVLVVGMRTNLYYAVGQVALAYLCFWLAVRLPLDRFDRFGDFSYGLYIYAFPVEQILALYGVYRWGLAAYVLLSLAIALVVAMASWFLVEKPFLRLKRLQLGELPAAGTPGIPPGWRRVWNPRLRFVGGTAGAHARVPRTRPYGGEPLTPPPPVRRSAPPTMGPRVPGGPPARTPDQELEAPW